MKEKFFSWFKKLNLPSKEELLFAFETFGKKTRLVVIVIGLIFIVSTLVLISKSNNLLMVDVPIAGGSLTEGVVGSPRFINPLLAISDADRDLTALVYSGLLRLAPGRGYELDIAKSYNMSSDGLTYTFYLKKDLLWSDGKKITADDIVFTVEKAQDQEIKSPKRGVWNGVTVTKVDDYTVQFSLKKPYNFFLDNMTMGILPAHLWSKIKKEQFPLTTLNTNPIGSGPYKIAGITKDGAGIPQTYNLQPFNNFSLGAPKIDLTIHFYNSNDELLSALENGEITSAGALSPAVAKKMSENGQQILQSPLPRTFTVFLNSSRNQIFLDPVIRKALDLSIDRQKLVDEVLYGYGLPINNVLPSAITNEQVVSNNNNLAEAKKLLTDNNWQINAKGELEKKIVVPVKSSKTKTTNNSVKANIPSGPISFTLATVNIKELKTAAEMIATNWSKLGIKINLEFFEPGDLNQDVIRPRRYDALLFGESIGRDYDLYPFWHSSQRLDPGLNIAMYVNNKVDELLEEIRESTQIKDLPSKYQELNNEIAKDRPAIFLYQPDFLYATPKDLKGVQLPVIDNTADRFAQVYRWYFKTDRVWSIFAKLASYF